MQSFAFPPKIPTSKGFSFKSIQKSVRKFVVLAKKTNSMEPKIEIAQPSVSSDDQGAKHIEIIPEVSSRNIIISRSPNIENIVSPFQVDSIKQSQQSNSN